MDAWSEMQAEVWSEMQAWLTEGLKYVIKRYMSQGGPPTLKVICMAASELC